MEESSAYRSPNESATEPQPCCTRLRCKSMYYRPDERPGLLHYSDTHHYWCSCTHERTGPDDGDATPLVCLPNRECFRDDD